MLYGLPNPHGGDIYGGDVRLDFSANTNPFGTPPGVLEAVSRQLQGLLVPGRICGGGIAVIDIYLVGRVPLGRGGQPGRAQRHHRRQQEERASLHPARHRMASS